MAASVAAVSPVTYGLGFVFAALSGIAVAVQSGINATLGAHTGQAFASVIRWGFGLGDDIICHHCLGSVSMTHPVQLHMCKLISSKHSCLNCLVISGTWLLVSCAHSCGRGLRLPAAKLMNPPASVEQTGMEFNECKRLHPSGLLLRHLLHTSACLTSMAVSSFRLQSMGFRPEACKACMWGFITFTQLWLGSAKGEALKPCGRMPLTTDAAKPTAADLQQSISKSTSGHRVLSRSPAPSISHYLLAPTIPSPFLPLAPPHSPPTSFS